MPKMAAAATAMHLRAKHAEAFVGGGSNRARFRRVETWPARAAIELGRGDEQGLMTSSTRKGALALFMEQGARSCPFCRVPAEHAVLLGR